MYGPPRDLVDGGAGAQQGPVFSQQHDESPAQKDGQQGHRDGGDYGPHDEGVPLPLADGAN